MGEEVETASPEIIIPAEWTQAAESIAHDHSLPSPLIALICGPKNSGKTTFSRILLNTLLQNKRYDKVAYLDTDVGQPEFTPPGCLALTIIEKQTPDLTIPCLKTPERSIFYGDTSSKRDPRTYLNNVFSLYDYFRKAFYAPKEGQKRAKPEVPLVINTPGWVKGNGYDALVEMLRYIAPTHMVQVRISTESKNLPAGAFWLEEDQELSVSLIEIASARRDAYNRSVTIRKDASLIRDLKIFAYFRQCFPSDFSVDTFKELAQALTAHRPYVVPISKIKVKHLHCQVSSSEIFYALNGSIVGLAVSSAKSSDSEHETLWCVGLGIVRGIDVSKDIFYVLTPVPLSILEKVDLFLQGLLQIPTRLLQVSGCLSPYMSTNVLLQS
ncbi:polynucleotide 5'-hydroxyl-kinase NOL9-like [Papaver somniferum]|uniref:polynucleotide 5'-hydroxyl-kinase NOL9-like n=1 Tax=Papaver somniferum TaxID=3469 RepID=UPI000E7043A1|nr:polynucleotide 5'-hydroxyl-kinase NOL9-like [Papaver somniferum]